MVERSFGEWLKHRRRVSGWTQKELALQVNCSISAIRKMESETRHPSAQLVERLAEVFDIPGSQRKLFLRFAQGDWNAGQNREFEDVTLRDSRLVVQTNIPTSMLNLIDTHVVD